MRRQPPAEERKKALDPVEPNPPRTMPALDAGVEPRALLTKAAPCVFAGSAELLPDQRWNRKYENPRRSQFCVPSGRVVQLCADWEAPGLAE
jgi:hypothetical protein